MYYFLGIVITFAGMYLIVSGFDSLIKSVGPRHWSELRKRRQPEIRIPDYVRQPLKKSTPKTENPYSNARPGQSITYRHPKLGSVTKVIQGKIIYTELWQRRKDSNAPWVPTGNVFTTHWLGETMVYEWKGKLWLLDSFDQLTDEDIKRDFLPHAREFGKSDETATVYINYPPGSWRITDIGKFEIQRVYGSGLRLQNGAIGRFIHAEGGTGLEGRRLVVEDYQEGGGGQDTAWMGWQITWDDILDIQ